MESGLLCWGKKWQQMKSCAHNLHSVMLGALWLKKKNNHQPAAGQVHASHFIGFGELPGSSVEGFPLWQFNRCHSFRHIKDGRGRRASWKAVTRDRRVSFEVQRCRPSHLFPTLSRTSGIQLCCFYWPWTFKLFCWPFTSKLWTTDPG